jgi:hypothetical protein
MLRIIQNKITKEPNSDSENDLPSKSLSQESSLQNLDMNLSSCLICHLVFDGWEVQKREKHIMDCIDLQNKQNDLKSIFCTICNQDLTLYTEKRQKTHIQKCKTSVSKTPQSDFSTCKICDCDLKELNQKKGIEHIKLCAKLHKVSLKEVTEMLNEYKSAKKSKEKKTESPTSSMEFDGYKYDPNSALESSQCNSVEEWLQSLGMSQYLEKFTQAGFDTIHVCSELNKEDLTSSLDITLPGHVKKLEIGIKQLKKIVIKNNVMSSKPRPPVFKPKVEKVKLPPQVTEKVEPKRKREFKIADDLEIPLLKEQKSKEEIAHQYFSGLNIESNQVVQYTQPIGESMFTKKKKLFDLSGIEEIEFEDSDIIMSQSSSQQQECIEIEDTPKKSDPVIPVETARDFQENRELSSEIFSDDENFQKSYDESCKVHMLSFRYKMEQLYKEYIETIQAETTRTRDARKPDDLFFEFIPPLWSEVVNMELFSTPREKSRMEDPPMENVGKRLFEEATVETNPIVEKPPVAFPKRKKKKSVQSSPDISSQETSVSLSQSSSQTLSQNTRVVDASMLPEGCPNYFDCDVADLKRTLSQFGVKSGSKKYMIEKLIQIWTSTHN